MALRALGGLALVIGHLAYGGETICESNFRCVNVGGGTAMRSIHQAMQSAIDAGNGDFFFAPGAAIACHCGNEGSICANFQSAHQGGSLQNASESVLKLIDNGCTTCGQVTSSPDDEDPSDLIDLSVSFVSDPVCCKDHEGDAAGAYCFGQKAKRKSTPKEGSDNRQTDELKEQTKPKQPSNPEVSPVVTPLRGRQAPVGTTTRRKPSGTTSNPNGPTTSPPSCSLIDAEDTDEFDEFNQKRAIAPEVPKPTPPPIHGRQAPIGTTTRRKPSGTTSNPNGPTTSPPSCSLIDAEDTDEYDEFNQKRDVSLPRATPQPILGRQAPIGTTTRRKPSGTTRNPNGPTTSPPSCSLVDAEDTDEFDELFRKRGEPGYSPTPANDEMILPREVDVIPTPEPIPEYEPEPIEKRDPQPIQEEAQPEENYENSDNNGEPEGFWANYDENTFTSSQRTVRAPTKVPWSDADHVEKPAKVRRSQQLLNLLPGLPNFGKTKPVAQVNACDTGQEIEGPKGDEGAWEFELLNGGPEGATILQRAGTDALRCYNIVTARDWDTILLSKTGNMQFQIYDAPNCNPCSECIVYNEDQVNTTTTSIGTKSGYFFASSVQILPNGTAPGTCHVV